VSERGVAHGNEEEATARAYIKGGSKGPPPGIKHTYVDMTWLTSYKDPLHRLYYSEVLNFSN
jgi:hypothetical protein